MYLSLVCYILHCRIKIGNTWVEKISWNSTHLAKPTLYYGGGLTLFSIWNQWEREKCQHPLGRHQGQASSPGLSGQHPSLQGGGDRLQIRHLQPQGRHGLTFDSRQGFQVAMTITATITVSRGISVDVSINFSGNNLIDSTFGSDNSDWINSGHDNISSLNNIDRLIFLGFWILK